METPNVIYWDKDDTLIDGDYRPYPDVEKILQIQRDKGRFNIVATRAGFESTKYQLNAAGIRELISRIYVLKDFNRDSGYSYFVDDNGVPFGIKSRELSSHPLIKGSREYESRYKLNFGHAGYSPYKDFAIVARLLDHQLFPNHPAFRPYPLSEHRRHRAVHVGNPEDIADMISEPFTPMICVQHSQNPWSQRTIVADLLDHFFLADPHAFMQELIGLSSCAPLHGEFRFVSFGDEKMKIQTSPFFSGVVHEKPVSP